MAEEVASDLQRGIVAVILTRLSCELRPLVGRNWFGWVVGAALAAVGATHLRQPLDQPIWRRRERHVVRMEVNVPGVDAAGNVPRRWGANVTAARPHIDTGTERRDLRLVGVDVANPDPVRRGKDDVLPAAAGERAPGQRQLAVLAFERPEAFVPVMARVDVDDDELLGRDPEVGLRHEVSKPMLEDPGNGSGGATAVTSKED